MADPAVPLIKSVAPTNRMKYCGYQPLKICSILACLGGDLTSGGSVGVAENFLELETGFASGALRMLSCPIFALE